MNRKFRIALWAGLLIVTVGSVNASAQSAPATSPKMTPEMRIAKRQAQLLETTIDETASRIKLASEGIMANMAALQKQSVSDIAYEDVFRMLQLQKVELVIELDGLDARSQLLQKKIESSKDESGRDETSRHVKLQKELLTRYLANQKESLATTKKLVSKGARSKEHLQRAERMVAEAKLRLNEFEIESKEASPAHVEAMFETTLAIAERKAKLQTVEKLLGSHIDARPQISKLNELTESRNTEPARLGELMFELKKLRAASSGF